MFNQGALTGILVRRFDGWVDPDGTSDGINQISAAGTTTVPSAVGNRLNITLPFRVKGRVEFQAKLAIDSLGNNGTVHYELSYNGGASFDPPVLMGTCVASEVQVFNAILTGVVADAGQLVIRLIVTANETRGGLMPTTATISVFNTVWNTDNFAVVYQSF